MSKKKIVIASIDAEDPNLPGNWCFVGGLCEHNLLDAPMIKKHLCSGIGGKCVEGSAYSVPPSRQKKIDEQSDPPQQSDIGERR